MDKNIINTYITEKEIDCIICLDNIILKKQETITLKCCHTFHNECFLEYMCYNIKKIKQNKMIECPMCRTLTEKEFIIYNLIEKFYRLKKIIKKYNNEMDVLRQELFWINIKKCLWYTKKRNLNVKEEDIMLKMKKIMDDKTKEYKKGMNIKSLYENLVINN